MATCRAGVALLVTIVGMLVPAAAEAAFPGQDGRIVFSTSDAAGDHSIASVDAQGGSWQTLVGPTTNALSGPTWSRDASQLLFAEAGLGGSTISRMPATGGARSTVAQSGLQHVFPAWSADGREVFYEDTDPSTGTGSVIYRASLSGAGSTPFWAGARYAEWANAAHTLRSPYEFAVEESPGYIVIHYLSGGAGFYGSAPDFAPDRSDVRLVYERGGDIILDDGLTGTETPLTSGPEHDSEPVFSPSGTRVAFVRDVRRAGRHLGREHQRQRRRAARPGRDR